MARRPAKMVKAALRVVQVLEFFDARRREATVKDFVEAFALPQSSASELLKSLVTLGYLEHDRARRIFRPTLRGALVQGWFCPALIKEGQFLARMDRLARSSGQEVVLAAMQGTGLGHLYIADDRPRRRVTYGPCDVFASALGRALLSTWAEGDLRGLVRRLNAEEARPDRWADANALLSDLANVAAVGHAATANEGGSGRGMIAVPLEIDDGRVLALGMSCEPHHIREAVSVADRLHELILDARARIEGHPEMRAPRETIGLSGRKVT